MNLPAHKQPGMLCSNEWPLSVALLSSFYLPSVTLAYLSHSPSPVPLIILHILAYFSLLKFFYFKHYLLLTLPPVPWMPLKAIEQEELTLSQSLRLCDVTLHRDNFAEIRNPISRQSLVVKFSMVHSNVEFLAHNFGWIVEECCMDGCAWIMAAASDRIKYIYSYSTYRKYIFRCF